MLVAIACIMVGAYASNAMILNVVTLDSAFLYRMTLNSADGNSTSGAFILYLPTGEAPVKGTVSAGRNDWRRIS